MDWLNELKEKYDFLPLWRNKLSRRDKMLVEELYLIANRVP